MNLFTKLKTYCILITSLFVSFNLAGQTVSEVVDFANQQFELENYIIASKEYNRAFYFGYEQKDYLSLQIAHCYQQLDKLKLASNFYDKAYRLSNNDSLKNEALLGNAFCYLMQKKYILSISELLNFSETPTPQQRIHYHFLKGIAHYGIQDDSISFYELSRAISLAGNTEKDSIALVNEFENVYHYNKRYNPEVAYIMSTILPGSGQFYSGSLINGLNSMVLIGGLYLIATQVIQYYSFVDAAIALFPWVQRYYFGGIEKSKELAISKKEEKRYESYLKILELTLPTDL